MKKCTLFTLCFQVQHLPQNHFGENREGALFSLFQNFRTNFFTITVDSLGMKLLTSTEIEKWTLKVCLEGADDQKLFIKIIHQQFFFEKWIRWEEL